MRRLVMFYEENFAQLDKKLNSTHILKIVLLLLLCLLLWIVTGCNSRKDVFLSSEDEITDYVESVIEEPVRYVRTVEFEEHSSALYIYVLQDREIEFEVEARIEADSFEALQLSNYHEVIKIKYEEAIMYDDFYVEERLKLAEKYDVLDEFDDERAHPYFSIKIEEFSDLEKIAKYIKEVDALYFFMERKPEKVEHIDINLYAKTVGALYATKNGDKFEFSRNKKDEIDEMELLEQLQIMYTYFEDFRE